MTLEEADKIIQIWGKYVEYAHGKLFIVFGNYIPESFLPFSIDTIEEASNIIGEYHHNQGNEKVVEAIRSTAIALISYKDDEESLLEAVNNFGDESWRKHFVPALKDFQNDWKKSQGV